MDRYNILRNALDELGIPYSEEQIEKFKVYKELVLKWNECINLPTITSEDEFILKHYIDSIMCAKEKSFIEANAIVDIGTGAGFPGIPLAILFPRKRFTLVDSLAKKINIVREMANEIGLKNVTLVHKRAEDLGANKKDREAYDLCISRAVARLAVLSEYCLPLVKVGGAFIAYKGDEIEMEISDSKNAIEALGGKIEAITPFVNGDNQTEELKHHLIIIKKISTTPAHFPRKAGLPNKEPIL